MQDQVNLGEEVKKIKKNIKARVEAKYGVYEGQGSNKTEKEQQLRTKAITRITERKIEQKRKRKDVKEVQKRDSQKQKEKMGRNKNKKEANGTNSR